MPFVESETSSIVMKAKDCTMITPLTLSDELLNLTDHTLVIELEGNCEVKDVEIRAVLNISALDERVTFNESLVNSQIKRFEIPIIKLRQDNILNFFISSPDALAIFKFNRLEISLLSQ